MSKKVLIIFAKYSCTLTFHRRNHDSSHYSKDLQTYIYIQFIKFQPTNLSYQNTSLLCTNSVEWTFSNLSHWGRVTHIYVSKLTIIGSDNDLSPGTFNTTRVKYDALCGLVFPECHCSGDINQLYGIVSSNTNSFRVTGLLCGEFIGHWWIPLVTRSFDDIFFDLHLNKRLSKQSRHWCLRRHCAHYDTTVM